MNVKVEYADLIHRVNKALKTVQRWNDYQSCGEGRVPDTSEYEKAKEFLDNLLSDESEKSAFEKADKQWRKAAIELMGEYDAMRIYERVGMIRRKEKEKSE